MTFRPQMEVSEKQAELYWYYIDFIEEHGYQPTLVEAAAHFGVTRRAIHDRLSLLSLKNIIKLPDISQERCVRLLNVKFDAVLDNDGLLAATKESLLTEGMAVVREYIIDSVCRWGYQPSYREMAADLSLTPVGVSERVRLLVDRGYADYSRPATTKSTARKSIYERALKLKFVSYQARYSAQK